MTTTSKQVTLTLDEETLNTITTLLQTRGGVTVEGFVHQCFTKGLKDTGYRAERNRRVYQETKAALAMFRAKVS